MKEFEIFTGKEYLQFSIPDEFTFEVLTSKNITPINDFVGTIKNSFNHPIESKPLKEIVKPGQKVAFIVNDNTRYIPQHVIVPEMINAINEAGVEDEDITIVVAAGTHRPMTDDELMETLGKEIFDRINIENHNAYDKDGLVNLGISKKLGVPIELNKTVVEADVRLGIGTIEPHLFAGYSGGVKIMSVGVAGIKSIEATHNAKMLEHPSTQFGVTENNVFREFLNEVASLVKLDFILNVVQNENKKPLEVFSGDPIKAFEKGVEFARDVYEAEVEKEADIVISVPRFPKTINLYQSTRAANGVIFGESPIVKQDGILIMPARCWDGYGVDELYHDLAYVEDPKELIIRAREKGFSPEGHKSFTISRILQRCNIYITDTDLPKKQIVNMHLNYAENINEALKDIRTKYKENIKGKHIAIVPDGILTMPRLKK